MTNWNKLGMPQLGVAARSVSCARNTSVEMTAEVLQGTLLQYVCGVLLIVYMARAKP